jgi:hypothetical protein
VKLLCSCGMSLGRLSGNQDGTRGGLVGIDTARTVTVSPAGQDRIPPDAGDDWMFSDLRPMFARKRIRCPARSCGRSWVFRQDTIAAAYARAVHAGRRSVELGVDL